MKYLLLLTLVAFASAAPEAEANAVAGLIPRLRLIPGMDTMVDTMDMDTLVDTIVLTDIYGAERRGKLRLIPGMDIMVDTMDLDMVHTMHTLIMDMDTGAERREKLKLLLKLQLLLILMP